MIACDIPIARTETAAVALTKMDWLMKYNAANVATAAAK